jgi:hypothetical protein
MERCSWWSLVQGCIWYTVYGVSEFVKEIFHPIWEKLKCHLRVSEVTAQPVRCMGRFGSKPWKRSGIPLTCP